MEVFKLKQELQSVLDRSIINKAGENNTSSAFFLPSEFKEEWNELSQSLLIDTFGDLIEDHLML